VADVDRLLNGYPIHLVFTDPPYNVHLSPRSNAALAGKPERAKDHPLIGDHVTPEKFAEQLTAWFGNIGRVLLPGRSFYIFGGYSNLANYPAALEASKLDFKHAVVWDKQHPVLSIFGRSDFMTAYELAFYGWRKDAGHQWFGGTNVPDLWRVKGVQHNLMEHLTEKPVSLPMLALEYSSRPNECVLDLFAGSGSTMIACQMMGRRAFLMEKNRLYCDLIVRRWEWFTGGKARHIGQADQEKSFFKVADYAYIDETDGRPASWQPNYVTTPIDELKP
jgi:DNA modification methylase